MSVYFFKGKFAEKSNIELEEIAKNNKKYVLEARIAALSIMKSRNSESKKIIDIDQELVTLENIKKSELQREDLSNKKIINELQNIQINKTNQYRLKNGNELQIQRITEQLFQIRIDHSKGIVTPVIICSLKQNGQIQYFPFFYIKGILIFAIISLVIILIDYFQKGWIPDSIVFATALLVPFTMVFQILMMPFLYSVVYKTFKEKLNK